MKVIDKEKLIKAAAAAGLYIEPAGPDVAVYKHREEISNRTTYAAALLFVEGYLVGHEEAFRAMKEKIYDNFGIPYD